MTSAAYLPEVKLARELDTLRNAVPMNIPIWVGGPQRGPRTLPENITWVAEIDELERRVELLVAGARS